MSSHRCEPLSRLLTYNSFRVGWGRVCMGLVCVLVLVETSCKRRETRKVLLMISKRVVKRYCYEKFRKKKV